MTRQDDQTRNPERVPHLPRRDRWSKARPVPLALPSLLCLAVLQSGCGVELRDRLKGIKRTIDDARENGAYKCAPRELAMAETHYEFTVDELDYGNYVGAKEEIEVAAQNARAA